MKTVLTLGTFDLLHVGHLELFGYCREWAGRDGRVVVAVNRDAFVERYKGRLPVVPYQQRVEMLDAVRDVDLVVCNAGDEDAKPTISVIQPNLIVVGDDWRDRDYLGQLGVTHEWLLSQWPVMSVVYAPRTRGVSTTALRG